MRKVCKAVGKFRIAIIGSLHSNAFVMLILSLKSRFVGYTLKERVLKKGY